MHETYPDTVADPLVKIDDINMRFAKSPQPLLRNLSLTLYRGELMALVGASGSGKTTLLRIIAGFEDANGGSVTLEDRVLSSPRCLVAPERRNIGVVFQEQTLFPHRTVSQNIAFGLHLYPAPERQRRIEEMLELLDIAELANRYPHELSGGQIQRAGIARAMAPKPTLLLLDEPFTNLDAPLCRVLAPEMRAIIKSSGVTAIFTAHNRTEVYAMADRIAFLRAGGFTQIDTPLGFYSNPADSHIARFFGPINTLPATANNGGYRTAIGTINMKHPLETRRVVLLIRPHDVELFPKPGTPCRFTAISRFNAHVTSAVFYGEYREVEVSVQDTTIIVHVEPEIAPAIGDEVEIAIPHHKIRCISEEARQ